MPTAVTIPVGVSRLGNWQVFAVVGADNVGAEGAVTANRVEIELQLYTEDGAALEAQVAFALRVSDSEMGAASSTAKLYAAGTPVGSVLEGSGTASARVQTNSSGAMTISVEETAGSSGSPAYRYLSVTPTYGTNYYLRPRDTAIALAFT